MARRDLAKRPAASGAVRDPLLVAWRTNNRVTCFLIEQLNASLWSAPLPGETRRTVRQLAAHLHNSRCGWLRTLGLPLGIPVPALVNLRRVTRRQLLVALRKSGAGMEALLARGLAEGGRVPATKRYVWRNLPLDVAHVLTYFVAHEAHHRGQIVMVARQLGQRLPPETVHGLWLWSKRMTEDTRR